MKIVSGSSWQWSGKGQWHLNGLFISQNLFCLVRICYMMWKILQCLASSCLTLSSQRSNKRLGDCSDSAVLDISSERTIHCALLKALYSKYLERIKKITHIFFPLFLEAAPLITFSVKIPAYGASLSLIPTEMYWQFLSLSICVNSFAYNSPCFYHPNSLSLAAEWDLHLPKNVQDVSRRHQTSSF